MDEQILYLPSKITLGMEKEGKRREKEKSLYTTRYAKLGNCGELECGLE